MIPYALLDSDFLEEKPEPDYYVCTEKFDPVTGGRFLSREEKQIANRLEFYDRIGKEVPGLRKQEPKKKWFEVLVS